MGYNSNTGWLSKPFTATDLRSALGITTSIGEINAANYFNGTSGVVNIWSPIKPVIDSSDTKVTDMAQHNYGFKTDMLLVRDTQMFTQSKQYGTWLEEWYQRPTGSVGSRFRWDDFDGYNSKATEPFSYSNLPGESISLSNSYDFRIDKLTNSINPELMAVFMSLSLEYAIAYRPKDSSDIRIAYLDQTQTNNNMLIFKCEFDQSGTWEFVFIGVSRDYTPGDQVMWMPSGYFTRQVSISGGGGGGGSTYASFNVTLDSSSINPSITGDELQITYQYIKYSVSKTSGDWINAEAYLTVHVLFYSQDSSLIGVLDITDDENLMQVYSNGSSGSYLMFMEGNNIMLSNLKDYNSDLLDKAFSAELRFSVTAVTTSTTWTIDDLIKTVIIYK